MEIYGRQILYTRDKVNLFSLNAYAFITENQDGILITRTDTEKGLYFESGEKNQYLEIFKELRDGMEQSVLAQKMKEVVPEDDVQDWINMLLQEGIIE